MNDPASVLNEKFGSHGVQFATDAAGLTGCRILNEAAEAEFCLQGAHVTQFQPSGEDPVLWISPRSRFETGIPIRGGIPICWPWFAGHPHRSDFPMHGFARISAWNLIGVDRPSKHFTELRFLLRESESTLRYFPAAFELEYRVGISSTLSTELTLTNCSDQEMKAVGCALHSYFCVANSTGIEIGGLENCSYVDKTDGMAVKKQPGEVKIDGEIDRIYRDTETDVVLSDPGLNRQIHVSKSGSQSTVVWNPWVSKSKAMDDFPDDGFRSMVCIETANADQDVRHVDPGDSHTIGQTIWVQPI